MQAHKNIDGLFMATPFLKIGKSIKIFQSKNF